LVFEFRIEAGIGISPPGPERKKLCPAPAASPSCRLFRQTQPRCEREIDSVAERCGCRGLERQFRDTRERHDCPSVRQRERCSIGRFRRKLFPSGNASSTCNLVFPLHGTEVVRPHRFQIWPTVCIAQPPPELMFARFVRERRNEEPEMQEIRCGEMTHVLTLQAEDFFQPRRVDSWCLSRSLKRPGIRLFLEDPELLAATVVS